jgi:uncharacterized oligopeptide transporter (OPT) family protein
MEKIKLGFLTIPEYLDDWIYKISVLKVGGIDLRQLTVRLDSDIVMMAAGGLMGIRTGVSLIIGAVLNYCIIAPIFIHNGDIVGKTLADGTIQYGFKNITMWSLWGGVAMMTTASLFAFFSKPKIFLSAFKGLFAKSAKNNADVLKDIELPMSVFVVGIPLVGGIVVFLAHKFFGVSILLGLIALPLIFIFTLIAVKLTALTSITPIGAMGKLDATCLWRFSSGNITTNLATAGITAEVAGNAANLLMDIKPGYMLGANRDSSYWARSWHIAAPLSLSRIFYLVFLHQGPANLITEQYPMPAATIWKAVAEVLTMGISNLSVSAQWAVLIGGMLGIVFEALRIITKGRFWISGVGIGLATVIPFNTCLAMFLGAFFFWLAQKKWQDTKSWAEKVFIQNMEPICAGIIAGGALMGIAVIIM